MKNTETNKYTGKVALWENKLKKKLFPKKPFNCTALLVSSIQAIGITWFSLFFLSKTVQRWPDIVSENIGLWSGSKLVLCPRVLSTKTLNEVTTEYVRAPNAYTIPKNSLFFVTKCWPSVQYFYTACDLARKSNRERNKGPLVWLINR